MGQIIRDLAPCDVDRHMPMRELHEPQKREVYEVVGGRLVAYCQLTGQVPPAGSTLVELDDKRQVAFTYDVHSAMELPG